MNRETDKILEQTEKKIAKIYERAQKEVDKKTEAYFKASEKRDAAQKKRLADGKITQEQYDNWRKGQLFMGEQYKQMQKQVSEEMLNASRTAAAYVNGKMPEVYALGYNAFDEDIGALKGYSFNLVDAATVRSLAMEDKTLLPYKTVNGKKEERWATQKVNSEILQGVIQGESVSKIAKRLRNVTDMDKNASIRNARTSMTSAENKGRMDSYEEATNMGIVLKKVWICSHDGKTRDAHLELNGVEQDYDKEFENSLGAIMYPGDPNAEPANVYNCRCTLISSVKGIRGLTSGKINYIGESGKSAHKVINGSDITGTWTRRADDFAFEIEDIINAQGFDGLPRIVSAEEFDDAVKAANGGEGFIAQRTYSAPDQETLDAYRQQLYNGDWYVDCSTGGAQYGQGMYCAADYTGTLSDGIKEEMKHYESLSENRYPKAVEEARNAYMQKQIDSANSELERVALKEKLFGNTTESEWDLYSTRTREQDRAFSRLANRIEEEAREIHGFSYIETFTLDSSAKIIELKDLLRMQSFDEVRISRMIETGDTELLNDLGAYAASKGYDAINAVGHGASGSYTVILNRTKLIIREP